MDKKTIRTNEIIGASIEVMLQNGYNGTSVKNITDAAGIPKGSFYNYFEGKEEYAVKAIQYYAQTMLKDSAILADANHDPLDRIKKFYSVKIDRLRNGGTFEGCFVGNLTEEVGNIYTSIAEEADKFHEGLERLILKALKEAREKNELTNEMDDEVIANFIINAWQGTLLRSKVANGNIHLDNFYKVLNIDLLR